MERDPRQQDLDKLNALVDGELPPAERATLAGRLANDRDLARTYATLAQLKATIGDVADAPSDCPAIDLAASRRLRPRRWIAAAAALAAVAAAGLIVAIPHAADTETPPGEGPTAITLASLPAGTTVPRLETAGLKLIGLTIDPGRVPLVSASYLGPHGCRLDLRAWPVGATAPETASAEHHRWTAGSLVYDLIAHGMPAARFALIAGAAEGQTAANADHQRIAQRLREAGHGAPPCSG